MKRNYIYNILSITVIKILFIYYVHFSIYIENIFELLSFIAMNSFCRWNPKKLDEMKPKTFYGQPVKL